MVIVMQEVNNKPSKKLVPGGIFYGNYCIGEKFRGNIMDPSLKSGGKIMDPSLKNEGKNYGPAAGKMPKTLYCAQNFLSMLKNGQFTRIKL